MFELKIDQTQEKMAQAFGVNQDLHEEITRSISDLYGDSDDWLKLTEALFDKFKDRLNETQMVYAMMKLGEFMHLVQDSLDRLKNNPAGFLLEALHEVEKARG